MRGEGERGGEVCSMAPLCLLISMYQNCNMIQTHIGSHFSEHIVSVVPDAGEHEHMSVQLQELP